MAHHDIPDMFLRETIPNITNSISMHLRRKSNLPISHIVIDIGSYPSIGLIVADDMVMIVALPYRAIDTDKCSLPGHRALIAAHHGAHSMRW